MSERAKEVLKMIKEETKANGMCDLNKIKDKAALVYLYRNGDILDVMPGYAKAVFLEEETAELNKNRYPLEWVPKVAKGKPAKFKGRGANRVEVAPAEPGLPYEWTQDDQNNLNYTELQEEIQRVGHNGFMFRHGYMYWFMLGGIARRDLKVIAEARKKKKSKIKVI